MSQLNIDAAIFGLDGVVTGTAKLHVSARKELFNNHLRLRDSRAKEPFSPFDKESDYLTYYRRKTTIRGCRGFDRWC
ncbi:MAG: hypothetical protein V3T60_03210 [Candidatus Binatia bacterium]